MKCIFKSGLKTGTKVSIPLADILGPSPSLMVQGEAVPRSCLVILYGESREEDAFLDRMSFQFSNLARVERIRLFNETGTAYRFFYEDGRIRYIPRGSTGEDGMSSQVLPMLDHMFMDGEAYDCVAYNKVRNRPVWDIRKVD